MAEPVLVQKCQAILAAAWLQVGDEHAVSPSSQYLDNSELIEAIRRSVNSKTKTYRYVLMTQVVAKLADANLDCACIQAKRGGAGAFDARSIAQDVIVPFDQEHDRVLGGAPEPYANNPLRIPEISAKYRDAQKDKAGWDDLCSVLAVVQATGSPEFTRSVFQQVLSEVLARLGTVKVVYPAPTRISLETAMSLIEQFTKERSGGDRFEVITAALFHSAGIRFGLFRDVRRSSITTADESSGMVSDVECVDENGQIVLVVEAKDRELTVSQVKGKISRIREHRITEAFFVASAVSETDKSEIEQMVRKEFVSGQNIYTTDLFTIAQAILAMMGEAGRRQFVDAVGQQLDRHSDVHHRKAWAQLLSSI